MPADGSRLNSILDFTCWWHINITREDVQVLTTKGKNSPPLQQKLRNSRIYRALCCPDCSQTWEYPGETPQLMKVRNNVHERVGLLRAYMEGLKRALDQDVLVGEKKDSILWNYKLDTDPVANADVRKELYEGWKRLNPLH